MQAPCASRATTGSEINFERSHDAIVLVDSVPDVESVSFPKLNRGLEATREIHPRLKPCWGVQPRVIQYTADEGSCPALATFLWCYKERGELEAAIAPRGFQCTAHDRFRARMYLAHRERILDCAIT